MSLTEDEIQERKDVVNSQDANDPTALYEMYRHARYLQRFDVMNGKTLKYQYGEYGDWLSKVSRNK